MSVRILTAFVLWLIVVFLAPRQDMGIALLTAPILLGLWKISDQIERLLKK